MMALRWADKLLSDGLEVGGAALALRWAGLLLHPVPELSSV